MTRPDADDLFLETLEQDGDVAWKLAEATARPAPTRLRDRIVEGHRRRFFGLPTPLPAALAFALVAVVALPLSLALVQTRAELEREQAIRIELTRVLAATAGGRVVPMQAGPGVQGRGTLVIAAETAAYLVLDLPEPPPGKAYEAWVIRDGQPVRAGMAPARPGIVTVRLQHTIRPGDITAVTLEKAGGVDAPTSDPILLGPA